MVPASPDNRGSTVMLLCNEFPVNISMNTKETKLTIVSSITN